MADPFLKVPGRLVLMPVALLHRCDLPGPVSDRLAAIRADVGKSSFSALALIRSAVSGVILLPEGQTTVAGYVTPDDGSEGTTVRMTARAAMLETVDGRCAPECKFAAFADSGVAFGVEYPGEGIENVTGKYHSDMLFAIRTALTPHDIGIPFPQRVPRHKGTTPAA